LNKAGYDLLGGGLVDDALRVLQLNAEEYPEDWNSFDSYGEALMMAGKKDLAIESYERALALDPSRENPRKMLRELRQE
jgi:tetratricopeptide (TPR) repeat protein